ncbi:MAG: dihydroorotate dehydrogenase [Candidatus Omnitrophota bacterium]
MTGKEKKKTKLNLRIKIADVIFKNPIWVASGTFGYAEEFQDFVELEQIGAIITKTITLNARIGNLPPRIVETPSGLLNSIGLENKGVRHFKKNYYPFLKKCKTRIIVSIAGADIDELKECAGILCRDQAPDAIEVNLSCPNVTHKGAKHRLIAQDADATEKVINALRKTITVPLIAKLSPNVTDISEIAVAAEAGGADAVSLVNTYLALAVDADTMKLILGKGMGGLSGPAIKPMALRAVYDVYGKIKIPVIGIGGVMSGKDVAEFMLCGANAVQIGTANFTAPDIYEKIMREFKTYLSEKKINKAVSIIGRLKGIKA